MEVDGLDFLRLQMVDVQTESNCVTFDSHFSPAIVNQAKMGEHFTP